MSKERTAVRKAGRRKRVPFGGHRLKLQLSDEDTKALKEAGYVARWFNDQHGRIEAAEAGGYEFVRPEEAPSLGHGAVHEGNSDLNGKVSKIVSKSGEPIRAYLMKIKKRYYDQDQAEKEKRNRAIDDAIRAGQPGGATVENQYIPKRGIQLPG